MGEVSRAVLNDLQKIKKIITSLKSVSSTHDHAINILSFKIDQLEKQCSINHAELYTDIFDQQIQQTFAKVKKDALSLTLQILQSTNEYITGQWKPGPEQCTYADIEHLLEDFKAFRVAEYKKNSTTLLKEQIDSLKKEFDADNTEFSELSLPPIIQEDFILKSLVGNLNVNASKLEEQKSRALRDYARWYHEEGYHDQLLVSLKTTVNQLNKFKKEQEDAKLIIVARQKLINPEVPADLLNSAWEDARENLRVELKQFLLNCVMLEVNDKANLPDIFEKTGQLISQFFNPLQKSTLALNLNAIPEIRQKLLIHIGDKEAYSSLDRVKSYLPGSTNMSAGSLNENDVDKFISDLFPILESPLKFDENPVPQEREETKEEPTEIVLENIEAAIDGEKNEVSAESSAPFRSLFSFSKKTVEPIKTSVEEEKPSKFSNLLSSLKRKPVQQITVVQVKNSEESKGRSLRDYLLFSKKKSAEEETREHIAAAYHFTGMLNGLPFDSIKIYYRLKNESITNNEAIKIAHDEIQTELTELRQLLEQKLCLFRADSGKKPKSIQDGWALIALLTDVKNTVDNFFSDYNKEKEILSTISSPAERMEQLIDLQQLVVQLLERTQEELKRGQIQRDKLIDNLDQLYTARKGPLIKKLQTAIKNAGGALDIFYSTEEKDALLKADAEKLGLLINTKTLNLQKLEKQNKKAVIKLDKHVTETRELLANQYTPRVTSMTAKAAKSAPDLSELNPLKETLNTAFALTSHASDNLVLHYAQLGTTSGQDLKTWQTDLLRLHQLSDSQLSERTRIKKNAKELERRLHTPVYQQSLLIMETLKKEYVQIITQAIIKSSLSSDDQAALRQLKENSDESLIDNDITKTSLDKIDLRLDKLRTLHSTFIRINDTYIYERFNFQSDNAAHRDDINYLADLLEGVKTHLHNNHMEDISDGVRSPFVQWLRIHVLKPLQKFQYKKGQFFTTLGACDTEKAVINIGMDAHDKLSSIAAPIPSRSI